jgi:branched-chain amino acid transport system permease protein
MGLPSGTYNRSYDEDMAIVRTRTQWVLLLLSLAILFIIPLWANRYLLTIIIKLCILIIAALGLNILTGYCGQISLATAAFMAVGAYTSAVLNAAYGVPFILSLTCGIIMAGLIGVVFGAPALRLKGFYLAMSTMAAQFILMYIIQRWTSVTGGVGGYKALPASIGPLVFENNTSYAYLVFVFLITCTFFARNLARTKLGRNFIAVRDNDLAAEVGGINVFSTKLLAFFIGCAYAGLAGGLWAHWTITMTPETYTLFDSIWYLAYIIVGGLGTTVGPFLGVALMVGLNEGLNFVFSIWGSGSAIAGYVFPAKDMFYGLVVMLFLIFEPRGLAHRWQILKTSYRLWPFSY